MGLRRRLLRARIRTHIRRSSSLALLAASALLATACGGVGSDQGASPQADTPAASAATTSEASTTTAACGPVETIGPYQPANKDQVHLEDGAGPALDTYTSSPPVSGPHASTTLPVGVYDTSPPLENVLHSMEHGAAVVWYAPSASPEQVAVLAAFVQENQEHTIMAPYDYPDEGSAGSLAPDTQMALAAWHRLQECPALSEEAVLEFLQGYRSPTLGGGNYLGEAPEPGFTI